MDEFDLHLNYLIIMHDNVIIITTLNQTKKKTVTIITITKNRTIKI